MKAALKLIFILFAFCAIAAGSLAFVNAATKTRIAEFARIEKMEALKKVFPDAESFTETTADKAWDAMKGSAKLGAVYHTAVQGYSGPIDLVFGMDAGGTLTGAQVLTHTETPGLGAKITTEAFISQYKGKTPKQIALKKDDPSNGTIDAISAATISSRAVTRAIREAADAAGGGN